MDYWELLNPYHSMRPKIIAERLGMTETETVEKIIKALIEEIRERVREGERVELRGLASWKLKNGKVKVKNFIRN